MLRLYWFQITKMKHLAKELIRFFVVVFYDFIKQIISFGWEEKKIISYLSTVASSFSEEFVESSSSELDAYAGTKDMLFLFYLLVFFLYFNNRMQIWQTWQTIFFMRVAWVAWTAFIYRQQVEPVKIILISNCQKREYLKKLQKWNKKLGSRRKRK